MSFFAARAARSLRRPLPLSPSSHTLSLAPPTLRAAPPSPSQELKEETGIEIHDADLIDLTALAWGLPAMRTPSGAPVAAAGASASASPAEDLRGPRGMYPSVGGCDEFIRLMYYSKEVDESYLSALKGKATGNFEEGECIVLDLVPYDQLWRVTTDAKTLSSMLLYERLKAEGRLE